MRNSGCFKLAIDLFQLTTKLEALIFDGFGVEVRIFSSFEQVLDSDPNQLVAYIENTKKRFAGYLELILAKNPEYTSRLEEITSKLLDFSSSDSIRVLYSLGDDKSKMISRILENLTETARLIHQYYPKVRVEAYSSEAIMRISRLNMDKIKEVVDRTDLQLEIYQKICG